LFICAAGVQKLYEYWRYIALSGGDTCLFERWGMLLLVPENCNGPLRFRTVERVRAPVRAGEFSLKEFLFDLGILPCTSSLTGRGEERYHRGKETTGMRV